MAGPLAGLVVADLTQNVAGPFCTQILGDMGADVIKVERPGKGDDARAWGPPFWGDESATFLSLNRNKRSLALNLRQPEGQTILHRLVGQADILVQSLRAGAMEALGLGYAEARALNPRLIYCSILAYGKAGPLRDLPGYDPLMQAFAGLMSVNGEPGRPPVRVGTSIVDMGTGMWAVLGILGALRERERTGRGQLVETSLLETALAWIPYQIMGYLATGKVPGPQGSGTPMIAPYEAFPTTDGYVMIAAGNDALWTRLAGALGEPGLARDPAFADNPSRVRNRPALFQRIAARTREGTTADWVERLRQAGVPCAPINTLDRVVAEPQTAALEILQPTPHPRLADFTTVGLPVLWEGTRPAVRRVPPLLGQDSAAILRELGYTPAEVRRLAAAGIVQVPDSQEGDASAHD